MRLCLCGEQRRPIDSENLEERMHRSPGNLRSAKSSCSPFHRKVLALSLLLIGGLVATTIRTAHAQQDGIALLSKVMSAYQKLSSYAGEANVDTILLGPKGEIIKQVGSSSVMKYVKPNKLRLNFSTSAGTRTIWSDGTTLWVYDGMPNLYTVGPSAPTLTAMLPLLLVRADVAAGMDPLFFLSQNTMPTELINVKLKGTGVFNGHQVYIVTGVTNIKPKVIRMLDGRQLTVPTSYWTWWIDRRTFLLHKIETATPHVTKQLMVKVGNREVPRTIVGTMLLRHTVSSSKPNTPLAPNEFVFRAPPSSMEKKAIPDFLKAGK
jgi:hypothetical protein